MNDRVWRDLALTWFDAMDREVGAHFSREFANDVREILATGSGFALFSIRAYCEKSCEGIKRSRDDDREFWLRCETLMVAIYNLALEDFR